MSNQIAKTDDRLKSLIASPAIKSRFDEMLGDRSAAFMSSVLSAVNSNSMLKKADPMSVISAAATAAAMDLPVNPSLGFAHIVPYGDKAQFQLGWKGYIQLAMRSGQYKSINLTPVYEGQIKNHNPFTGEMGFADAGEAKSSKQIGYLLYFKLLTGFEKYFYMTKEQCETHGKKYSKTYARGKGRWVEDFEAMALKTVCKLGLSRYGILSLEMQKAMEVDQGAISESGEVEYVDSTVAPQKDVSPKEQEPSKPKKLKKLIQNSAPGAEQKVYAPSTNKAPI